MKDVNEADTHSNVIKVKFNGDNHRNVPVEVSHPASKHYPVEESAKDLLSDFEGLIDSHKFKDDYIFHHDKKQWGYKAEFGDSLTSIVDKVSLQIKRIHEDTKRIKFYIDDL